MPPLPLSSPLGPRGRIYLWGGCYCDLYISTVGCSQEASLRSLSRFSRIPPFLAPPWTYAQRMGLLRPLLSHILTTDSADSGTRKQTPRVNFSTLNKTYAVAMQLYGQDWFSWGYTHQAPRAVTDRDRYAHGVRQRRPSSRLSLTSSYDKTVKAWPCLELPALLDHSLGVRRLTTSKGVTTTRGSRQHEAYRPEDHVVTAAVAPAPASLQIPGWP